MTKKARRPNLFNRDKLVETFVKLGVGKEGTAKSLASDLQLIVPILIRNLGADQINRILDETTDEFDLTKDAFWSSQMEHLVQWARTELDEYKDRKKASEVI
jgi:hypothetical protein